MSGFEENMPRQIGPYRFVRLLGKGAMGAVYEVVHEHLGVHRALKLFRTDGRNADFLRKRFLAEGKLLARLDHPRLVRVHDLSFDEADGTPYFTMDLVTSPSGQPLNLADAQDAKDGTSEERLAGWYCDMCEALNAIHAAGIVHRDIKPENILVGKDGRAVLSDFGISRILDAQLREDIALTRTIATGEPLNERRILGTVMYLAPEVRLGGIPTPASDSYALGMTFFRLLTGLWYEPGGNAFDLLAPFNPAWKPLFTALLAQDPSKRSLPPLTLACKPRRHWIWWTSAAVLVFCIAMTALLWPRNERVPNDPQDEPPAVSEPPAISEPPIVDVSDAFLATPGLGRDP